MDNTIATKYRTNKQINFNIQRTAHGVYSDIDSN